MNIRISSRPRTFIPKAPLTVQAPQVSLTQIAAFNIYQQYIEPFLRAKRIWGQNPNIQIIAKIKRYLEEKSVLKKLDLTGRDARALLNKKPELIFKDIFNRLQTLKQTNLAHMKPYLQLLVKIELNQLLTKNEIEKVILPYFSFTLNIGIKNL